MSMDPILYPNIYDTEGFRRLDISGDVGLDTLIHLHNPTWFDLTSG